MNNPQSTTVPFFNLTSVIGSEKGINDEGIEMKVLLAL